MRSHRLNCIFPIGSCVLAALLLVPAAARAQQCLGLPLEPGQHAVGPTFEVWDHPDLWGGSYRGSAREVAWGAVVGAGFSEFPPEDPVLTLEGQAAWFGLSRTICPAVRLRRWSVVPESFSMVPGDSRTTTLVTTIGIGLGRAAEDSTRARLTPYAFPHYRIVRVHDEFGEDETTESSGRFVLETGVTLSGGRFYGSAGLQLSTYEYSEGRAVNTQLRFGFGVMFPQRPDGEAKGLTSGRSSG